MYITPIYVQVEWLQSLHIYKLDRLNLQISRLTVLCSYASHSLNCVICVCSHCACVNFIATMKLIIGLALLGLAAAQFQNGRILDPPVPVLCAQRTIHERTSDGKGYFFSWRDPALQGVEEDWLNGRNYCRKRCMDLVSLETSSENEWIKAKLLKEKVKYIWTSGRLCDFKGCERPDLQPVPVNGWFWTAELQKLAPTTQRDQNDWSQTGGIGKPQPDNREALQGGAPENCLAVLNNFYKDGVNWHDVACHHKKPWVCEENEALLKYVRYTNPNLRI